MSSKEEFIEIFKENITRDGADNLLNYLEHKSDFFTAPASARYHSAGTSSGSVPAVTSRNRFWKESGRSGISDMQTMAILPM